MQEGAGYRDGGVVWLVSLYKNKVELTNTYQRNQLFVRFFFKLYIFIYTL